MWNKILLINGLTGALLLAILLLILGNAYTMTTSAMADMVTIEQDVGVELSPGYNQKAEPGTVVTYTHILTNTGTTSDTFTLEATSSEDWPIELLEGGSLTGSIPLSLQVGANLTGTFVVSLAVPANAIRGTVDHTVVTATSWISSTVQDTLADTTIVQGSIIYSPLVMRNYPPLWQQASGTDEIIFYNISTCPSNPLLQYASTPANGMYRSADGGKTWEPWALNGRAIPVIANPLYCAEAFAAVWGGGVYRVTGRNQALSINQGLDDPCLYGLTIITDSQTLSLYAGSDSHGVYRTDASNINWTPTNNGISDLRIRSLDMISNTLYAGSRRCTYYYSDDEGDSWSAKAIVSGGQAGECADAQVWAIAYMDNMLYAGLGGDKGLYRSPDGGTYWTPIPDISGVTISRFGLYPYKSRLYVGTYGRGVYTCRSDGRCQPLPNGGLGMPNIRGLTVAEIPNTYPRLLAGSDDGIWWVPLAP